MSKQKFKINDKVLVPHTDKQYHAKVLQSEVQEDGVRYYLLHYLGWNRKWDEWVTEDEIRPSPSKKITLRKKTLLPKAPIGSKTGQQKPETADKGEAPKNAKKRKAEEAEAETSLQLQLEIPPILQKQLLDEYDLVAKSQKTVVLPRHPNAMQILRQFYEYGKKELRCTNTELQMLTTGLEEYMDKTLEDFLLYEIEWQTASSWMRNGMSASSIYGAEHLLRLMVKIPELVSQTSVTVQQATALNARLREFLDFLVINRHAFFANVKEYRVNNDQPPQSIAFNLQPKDLAKLITKQRRD